jgi:hypothetical protein
LGAIRACLDVFAYNAICLLQLPSK